MSKRIWQFPYIRAIQTGLELDDDITALSEIEQGKYPAITPFAIVEEKNIQFVNSECYTSQLLEKRSGILLTALYSNRKH